MDIAIITQDPYLRLFLGGLIFYLGTLFLFIEKVEEKAKQKKERHDKDLETKYSKKSSLIKLAINIFDSLRENRIWYDKIRRTIDTLNWSGVIFLSGCILGFILKISGFSQDLAIMLIASGLLYFFLTLIYLIIWNWKNK